jgi:septal ring factor EnvC (AmiA/AmiB activator)
MAKYIRCDCCGKRIDFGEDVYQFAGYCGLFCSADCFADAYANCLELNADVAENCCKTICDDNEDKRKLQEDIARAEEEIEALTRQLKVNRLLLTQYE